MGSGFCVGELSSSAPRRGGSQTRPQGMGVVAHAGVPPPPRLPVGGWCGCCRRGGIYPAREPRPQGMGVVAHVGARCLVPVRSRWEWVWVVFVGAMARLALWGDWWSLCRGRFPHRPGGVMWCPSRHKTRACVMRTMTANGGRGSGDAVFGRRTQNAERSTQNSVA
jgi:hypothetical protein